MVGTHAAIGILHDALFTITATTGGDNGTLTRTASGQTVTFLADRVRYRMRREVEDHSAAQMGAEWMRDTKLSEQVVVETKLERKANAALLGALLGTMGVVVQFSATAPGANVGTAAGGGAMVESVEFDYAGPSMLRFTLRNYGAPFTVTNA